MTTPLDRNLAERLGRLAAAVPVSSRRVDPVHAGAVQARQRVRMAWLTPLVALIVLVLVAGVIGLGSLGILNDPVSAATRQGDFELTIRSVKAHYMRGEPIEMSATLTYVGPDDSVRISHASSPMTFGIDEPVHGLLLNGVWAQSCGASKLNRGVGLEVPFTKSFASEHEMEPAALAFIREPRLVLPPGTWHPYVVAEFALGDCGSTTISMRAGIAIDVLDGPTWVDRSVTALPTPPPGPSPTPVPEDLAIHFANLDPVPVEIVFRDRVIADLACGETAVVSVWELESTPLYTFIVRNGVVGRVGAATLDWGFPAGILIRDGSVLSGPWPMSYGPASDACSGTETEPPATSEATPTTTPNLPQTSTETDGGFELVLTSDKHEYRPDEPILIEGRLTYMGPSGTVLISHDTGLISFRIFEKVFGRIQVGGLSDLMCGQTTLARNEPFITPFRKSGGFGDGPDDGRLMAWMQDPLLRLPVGTWHITASAGSPCLGPGAVFHVGGQVTIVVRDDA